MRKKRRWLRHLILLMLLGGTAAVLYVYLAPLLNPVEIPVYTQYTVRRGDIATDKSFSASISVLYSETHQNTTRAESIREIYVERGREVTKGTKLMLLDNGEVLKAGLDGVVTEMNYGTSDVLRSNATLIQIADLTNLQVSLSIDEYDVRNIAAGQKCVVTIVPLGLDFEAEITHVDRVSASSGQVAYYTATARIVVPENVLPGMTASVTMPDESAENVLLLDMAALTFDEDNQPCVLLREGDAYVPTPVTVGLSDGMQVEILSGLAEGDTVWAVTGTETVKSAFTLSAVYKALAGEKVVIRNVDAGSTRSTQGGGQGRSQSGGSREGGDAGESAMPDSFTFPQTEGEAPDASRGERSVSTDTDIPTQPNRERKNEP